MQEIFDFLRQHLGENEFFKGGFVLLLIGSMGYWLRKTPFVVWGWIKRLLLVTVSFDERSSLYQLFQSWLSDQGAMDVKRDVVLKVDDRADPPKILMVPDRRGYLIKLDRVWCRLQKKRDKDDSDTPDTKTPSRSSNSLFTPPERIWLTTFFWNRKKVLDTLHYIIREYTIEREEATAVYQFSWGFWREVCKLPLKNPDHLVLRDGQLEEIFEDTEEFLGSRQWYEERQIPYQRGYLFCGPPGTGKTTLAATLASRFKLRLCLLDLGTIEKDEEIRDAFNALPSRAVVVIEDFDSFFQGRKMLVEKSSLTFSGLLNSINGIISSPGRILIITTNITQDVDPAMMRSGRIDRVFKLDFVDEHQARRITKKFLPEVTGEELSSFVMGIGDHQISPADLVGHFQKHRWSHRDKVLDRQAMIRERDLRLRVDAEIRKQEEEYAEERRKREEESGPQPRVAGGSHP